MKGVTVWLTGDYTVRQYVSGTNNLQLVYHLTQTDNATSRQTPSRHCSDGGRAAVEGPTCAVHRVLFIWPTLSENKRIH